jgi:hypothetical protein
MVVIPATWGIGAIGGEGFGMFAPIVPATVVQLTLPSPEYYVIGMYWAFSIAVTFLACILAILRDRIRRKDTVV